MRTVARYLGAVLWVASVGLGPIAAAQDRPAPAGTVPVFNPVEGRVTVLSSKPEGATVRQGDVVCELDSAPLKARLAVEELLVRGADADLNAAKLAREAAEIAISEYTEGTYKHKLQTYLGEVTLADVTQKRAEDQLEWSNRMLESGYVSLGRNIADKIALKRAIFAFEAANTQYDVFQRFTKDKELKRLKAELEQARAGELQMQARRDRHESARAGLSRQVERCRVIAPAAGRIRYGRPMGVGAVIHDGDVLFQLVPEPASTTR